MVGIGAALEGVKHTVRALSELDLETKLAWDAMRAEDSQLYSPFFSRSFVEAVADVRPETKVLVSDVGGKPFCFLPFERKGRYGFPAARMISDAQGVIATTSAVNWRHLMSAADVSAFIFHAHINPHPSAFRSFNTCNAFLCDLVAVQGTYDEWLISHSRTVAKQRQKTNKFYREVKSPEFDFDCRDHECLEHLLNLKSQQYRRTNIFDKFSVQWIRDLTHRLLDSPQEPRGQLSVLRSQGRIVAAHFGMRERDFLHYWFPVYDMKYSRYSPGTILFLKVVEQCYATGITKIDFGYGDLPYKWKLCNQVTQVHQGVYSQSALVANYLGVRHHFNLLTKRLPGKEKLKAIRRSIFPKADGSQHGA